ncbi:MAG: hypothetical protein ACYTAO_16445 [Planctomycetota bacterium]
MAKWLEQYNWDYFLTVTTRLESTNPHRLLQKVGRALGGWPVKRAYLVTEPFYSRNGYHVHGLCALPKGAHASPAVMWARLFKQFGRTKIEAPRDLTSVSNYLSKYLTKSDLDDYSLLGDWT